MLMTPRQALLTACAAAAVATGCADGSETARVDRRPRRGQRGIRVDAVDRQPAGDQVDAGGVASGAGLRRLESGARRQECRRTVGRAAPSSCRSGRPGQAAARRARTGAFPADLAARTAQQRGEAFDVTFDEQGWVFEIDWLYRP